MNAQFNFKLLFEAKYIRELESLIIQIISERKLVSIEYEGVGPRILEIYDFGQTKTGISAISAYQISGPSESGDKSGWKIFNLDKITKIDIKDQTFNHPRPKWNPNDNQIFVRKQTSVIFQ